MSLLDRILNGYETLLQKRFLKIMAKQRVAAHKAEGHDLSYVSARRQAAEILELSCELDCTYAEAQDYYDDPANETMCEVCGWTLGMVCPECSKGCGCVENCSGWRHQEYAGEDYDDYDDDMHRNPYADDCECPDDACLC